MTKLQEKIQRKVEAKIKERVEEILTKKGWNMSEDLEGELFHIIHTAIEHINERRRKNKELPTFISDKEINTAVKHLIDGKI